MTAVEKIAESSIIAVLRKFRKIVACHRVDE